MKYFLIDLHIAIQVWEAVWKKQDEMGSPKTTFSLSASGPYASVWTEDPYGEGLFTLELQEKHIPVQRGDEKQVKTWLDDIQAQRAS